MGVITGKTDGRMIEWFVSYKGENDCRDSYGTTLFRFGTMNG